ncbi:MAG: hydantoinase/oxoprolinase family protein, partial [Methylophilaceae bacterium]
HASASVLATYFPNALLLDIGSTTTDIIPIADGKVADIGLTDAQRMREDTLMYSGVVRTPVMALAQKLLFEEAEINVAAEYFATLADVYRLTDDLLPEADLAETADGKGKTLLESARRLARMIGHDVEAQSVEVWRNLAQTCKKIHINQIKSAVKKHLKSEMVIVGMGAGEFLAEAIADELHYPYQAAPQLLDPHMEGALAKPLAVCFPAYAVARLALLRKAAMASC